MVKPEWWDVAQEYLHGKHEKLALLSDECVDAPLLIRDHYFEILLRAIIGQQISTAAANTIWARLIDKLDDCSPDKILNLPDETLRSVGLSYRKIGYAQDLARHFKNGHLDSEFLENASDEEVIQALTDVRGIGVWTAQMFLMFALGRADVWPIADIGLQKGIQLYFELPERPTAEQSRELGAVFTPYRSYACWVLWRSIDKEGSSQY